MILVIETCSEAKSLHYSEFVKPVTDIIKKNCIVRHFSELKTSDINKAKKIIICGSALRDHAAENYKKFNWLKKNKKPVLGICAGMQIISKVFGGKIIECAEIGVQYIKVIKKNKLIDKDEIKVYSLHNFAATLPKDFKVIAKSKNCIQAIKHKEKEIYGFLFHPEVLNKKIIESFVSL